MLPSRPNRQVLTQRTSPEYQSYIEIAIDVFRAQSPSLINSLKDFLTCLPSPKAIELVLAMTIYRLAEADPPICRWILQHPNYLMPELDLVALAVQSVVSDLESQNFLSGRDFRFEKPDRLYLSDDVRSALFALLDERNCAGDRLLLEEVLHLIKF